MDKNSNQKRSYKYDSKLDIIDAQKNSFSVLDQDQQNNELIEFISDLASKTESEDLHSKIVDIQLKIKKKQYCLEKNIYKLANIILYEVLL